MGQRPIKAIAAAPEDVSEAAAVLPTPTMGSGLIRSAQRVPHAENPGDETEDSRRDHKAE